ncbi:SPFH domain / Band 7 family protein [Actinomadura meyerae]|uniref:SPFH domain / Band 7 family protein n=1 Tax=Actinomadura meyerae TaxID=240840 RepID=A0A239CZU9_9ACTN|nr:SPFH domain-containing protein [Actinomadura meyerae]SNS24873.1 SPFH domain / Band 7 family protein [Actinomadura meyerae]
MVPLAARESPLPPSTAFLIVLGLAVAVAVLSGLRHVGPSERLVVRRFGRTRGVRGPGLRYLLPLADSGVRVPAGPRPHDLWFRAMTRDGVPVRLKAHALMGADDPVRYAAAADTSGAPSSAAQAMTEVALRGLIADRDLADLPSLLAGGDDPELVRRVAEAVRPWGVAASLVSITDATVPVRSAGGRAAALGSTVVPPRLPSA